MRLYVGVTDFDWYSLLSQRFDLEDVNFWSPGGAAFKVLSPGELFLFKLKARHGHMIVGGGVFGHATRLPLSMAWQTFGETNGARSLSEMAERIRKYQSPAARLLRDPVIGCRLIQQPFFFPKEQWFRVPDSYQVNAVSGMSYGLDEPDGAWLMQMVQERLPWEALASRPDIATPGLFDPPRGGAPQLVTPRLGQSSFRIAVMDGYGRRCSVTGERTVPILDAAHIKPWAEGGEHKPGNGVLLRTDVHRLFDLGYVTITHDHRFEVSPRLREHYENGVEYYALHGRPIRQPLDRLHLPAADALDWHHANRWEKAGNIGLT